MKAYLENRPRAAATERKSHDAAERATGTYGPGLVAAQQNPTVGARSIPVEYATPPEAKR